MDGSADGAGPAPEDSGLRTSELARTLGLRADTARRLVEAGYASPEVVRDLSTDALDRLGVDPEERETIRHGPGARAGAARREGSTAGVDAQQIVDRWVGSQKRVERNRRPKLSPSSRGSTEVLKKWVGGDDRAMEEWIRSSEVERPPPTAPPRPGRPVPDEAATTRPTPAGAVPTVSEREETVVRWLTGLLDRVKSDQFDPASMVQEVQDLQRQLYDERTKRTQLEEQVEHVKRGSIAVIKYVRSREAKDREVAVQGKDEEISGLKLRLAALEGAAGTPRPDAAAGPTGGVALAPEALERVTRELDAKLREEFAEREHEFIDRETELRRRVVQLEGDVRRLTSEGEEARGRAALTVKEGAALDEDLTRRLAEIAQRERDLVSRENELRAKFEEIRIHAEEIERRRGPLEFKERELAAYDQQMQSRRQALDIEARRLESMRKDLGATTVVKSSEAQLLDDLRHELSKKETELRARESQVAERLRALEGMTTEAAEAEADRMHADSVTEANAARVKSGVRRLDDLMFGGFPPGAQALVNGPAHTGKDVLARLFSTEGLRQGVPSIWVITDKTYGQVREDLATLYPGFADAEKKGMLRYVDLYSLALGKTSNAPGVRFLSSTDRSVLDQLGQTVNGFAEELKEKFPTYRLIFESVSTITAYLDTTATFRFLQPFVGRRKLDGAVGYYELESGMHSESDLETLEHMMDGSLNLKIEQMKTFLAVRGLGEAQARSWVGYTFTKRSFNLGSFSLEHIR